MLHCLDYDPRPAAATVPARLRRIREGRGLTQAAFAHLMGVCQLTFWRWENGARPVTAEGLRALRRLDGERR